MVHIISLVMLAMSSGVGMTQEKPEILPKKELPRKAVCVVCTAGGGTEGPESVAAGVRFRGQNYYFCNAKEVETFKKDPESFLPPVLPRPAPEMKLMELAGTPFDASALKGKVVVVDFWATWCKPCVDAMPEIQKLQDKWAGKGVVVLGVSIDEKGAQAVNTFLSKKKNLTYRMLLDSGTSPAWRAFGVKAIPALFVVDKEGKIVQQWMGKPNRAELEKLLATLTAP